MQYNFKLTIRNIVSYFVVRSTKQCVNVVGEVHKAKWKQKL